jgi:hypothetical protein
MARGPHTRSGSLHQRVGRRFGREHGLPCQVPRSGGPPGASCAAGRPGPQSQQSSWPPSIALSGVVAQQPSPRQVSSPSVTATPAINKAAIGSSHHQPSRALPARPRNTAPARYAHSRFWAPSPWVADEPRVFGEPLLRNAEKRHPDEARRSQDHAQHARLRLMCGDQMADRLEGDERARRKNCTATSFCARSSAAWESSRCPVKRQTITRLATPSIAQSIPNPIRAIDPRRDARRDGDDPLGAHPHQAEPRQRPGTPGGRLPLGAGLVSRDRGLGQAWERGLAHLTAPWGSVAASSLRPRSLREYITILPSRRLVTRPAERSSRRWWETRFSARSTTHARSQTHSSPPSPRAAAMVRRVGSPSALA